jgi:Short C-terminal domain
MPGLLRGVARTAVVAGTATAVSGRVARRQAEHFADRDQAIAANRGAGYAAGAQQASAEPQQYAPPPAAPAEPGYLAELEQLAQLRNQGVISDQEFEAKKRQLLGI